MTDEQEAELRYEAGMYQSLYETAKARIEALEKHKRLQTEDIMNLGAQLGQAWVRIEALEGCLREIKDQYLTPDQSSAIAKAALAPACLAEAERRQEPEK
jgi:uncharacterized coiled-coil protein SlyX